MITTDNMASEKLKKNKNEVRRITLATHLNIILYALCYWIQIGVMPYLTKKLGVDTKVFGYLQSVFAFVQLCGGPLFGRFGDLFGGQSALILAFIAASSSYGLLALASSTFLLFLSRLPSVCMHSMQGAQMVITDVTTSEDRASGIGHLGISYGIGMVTGPLIGGFVTHYFNEQTAAFAAMLGSILSIVLVILFIPTDTKQYSTETEKKDEQAVEQPQGSIFDFKKYASIFEAPNFSYLFMIKAVSGLPIGIFQAMFSIFAMDYFHLEAKDNGFVLSYVGIMSMLVQGFGIGYLNKRFTEDVLIKYSIIAISLGYFLLIFVSNIWVFLIVLLPLICGGAVLTVIITSLVTKSVSSKDTGAALGLSMATNSMIRTVSPTIGGILYATFGFPIFGIGGFVINAFLALYLFSYGKENL